VKGWLVVKKRSNRTNAIRVRLLSEDGTTLYHESIVDVSAQPINTQAVYKIDNIDLSGLGLNAESLQNAFIPPPPGYEERVAEKKVSLNFDIYSYDTYKIIESMQDVLYYR